MPSRQRPPPDVIPLARSGRATQAIQPNPYNPYCLTARRLHTYPTASDRRGSHQTQPSRGQVLLTSHSRDMTRYDKTRQDHRRLLEGWAALVTSPVRRDLDGHGPWTATSRQSTCSCSAAQNSTARRRGPSPLPDQALYSVIHMQLQAPMRRRLSLQASGSSSLFLASIRVLGNFHLEASHTGSALHYPRACLPALLIGRCK